MFSSYDCVSQPFCSQSGSDHRIVTTPRCPGCNLKNPRYQAPIRLPPSAEVVDLDDDFPMASHSIISSNPGRIARTPKAIHLAKTPSLTLGHAEFERQHANKRETDRKHKSGITAPPDHTLHFSVGLARFVWDEYSYQEGNWTTCLNNKEWLVRLANTEISFANFLLQIRSGLEHLTKRTNVKTWLIPSQEGEWRISHINPSKRGAQEILEWSEPCLLSDAISQDVYNIKTQGKKELISLWLCWEPEQPEPAPVEASKTPRKKEGKEEKDAVVKKEKNVKKEVHMAKEKDGIKKENNRHQDVKSEDKPQFSNAGTKRKRSASTETPIENLPSSVGVTTRHQYLKSLEADRQLKISTDSAGESPGREDDNDGFEGYHDEGA